MLDRFRRLLVDDCSRSRLFAMALEYFFLRRDPADSSPVYCIIRREYFDDARNMLRHLRDCNKFEKGEYWCPTCNTYEHFKTSSRKKCSWLRSRLGNKIRKGIEEALKLLPGSKPTLCSNCRSKIEAVEWPFGHLPGKPSWASLGEEGLTAPSFPTSPARPHQQHGNPPPAQKCTVPRSPPLSELRGNPPVGELNGTPRLSELRDTNPEPAGVYSYALDGPQASRFNFGRGVSEIDSRAVGFGAFPELAGEQAFPTSSKPPYAPVEPGPLVSYDTSPTEVSSVALAHASPTVFSVSPTSSTDSNSGGPSRRAHLSPEKSFSTNPDNLAAERLNSSIGFGYGHLFGSGTMPAAFVSHPAVSMDSFQETSWNAALADMRTSPSLTIDTAFMESYAFFPPSRPHYSYGAKPTTESFRTPPIRAMTNPSNGVLRPITTVDGNGSPMSAHSSSSSMSPSSSQSPSSLTATTATASPTSDASGPVSTDEMGAGPLRCPECDFQPSGKNAASFGAYLRKHRLKHSPRRVKCNDCPATFTRLDNCKSHARTAHHGGRKRAGSSAVSPPDLRRKKTRGSEAGES